MKDVNGLHDWFKTQKESIPEGDAQKARAYANMDAILSLRVNTVLRNSIKGMSSFPSSSGLPSKSPAVNVKKRISRRFSIKLISLLLNISSLLPGTLLTRPGVS